MIMSLQAPRHSKSTKLNFRVSDCLCKDQLKGKGEKKDCLFLAPELSWTPSSFLGASNPSITLQVQTEPTNQPIRHHHQQLANNNPPNKHERGPSKKEKRLAPSPGDGRVVDHVDELRALDLLLHQPVVEQPPAGLPRAAHRHPPQASERSSTDLSRVARGEHEPRALLAVWGERRIAWRAWEPASGLQLSLEPLVLKPVAD